MRTRWWTDKGADKPSISGHSLFPGEVMAVHKDSGTVDITFTDGLTELVRRPPTSLSSHPLDPGLSSRLSHLRRATPLRTQAVPIKHVQVRFDPAAGINPLSEMPLIDKIREANLAAHKRLFRELGLDKDSYRDPAITELG